MEQSDKKRGRVTDENRDESRKLKALWLAHKTATGTSQAEFGGELGIGSQSAVGNMLNGEMAISLKAAQKFAQGLNCSISDFSPRLAAAVQGISAFANMGWPFEGVDFARWERLTERQKGQVEKVMNDELDRIEAQHSQANGPQA